MIAVSLAAAGQSPNPSNYGESVTFTATVTPQGPGTPTGTVTFEDGGSTLGTTSLSNGKASLSTSSLTVGSHSILGSYSGDSNYAASTSRAYVQVINPAPTTTILSSSANPAQCGQAVTFTMGVIPPGTGTPTGTITLKDGGNTLGTFPLANGGASFSTSTLAVGTHSLTASYRGDSNFMASKSAVLSQTVNLAITTTALGSSPEPASIAQSVTFTATVTTQYAGLVTGSVTFKDGTKTIATVNVVKGQATFSTSYTTNGTHSITASYSGDTNNTSSTSATLTEYIVTLPTTSKTVVSTSGSPSVIGQAVTFTATVTSPYGRIPDGETVIFSDGTTTMGSGTTAGGVATGKTSSLAVGTHSIGATYTGDPTFNPSTGTVAQVVQAYATTTTLGANPNPAFYGQPVTLTVKVTTAGSSTPTGTVTFLNGTATLGSAKLDPTGGATLSTTKLPVGSDSLTAGYSGDSLNSESTSNPLTQAVNPAQITLTLSSNPNPSTAGQAVKFTATLSSNGGMPTGQITFSSGSITLGTSTISGGKAIFSTSALAHGTDQVTATYSGSTNFSSASASLSQVVN